MNGNQPGPTVSTSTAGAFFGAAAAAIAAAELGMIGSAPAQSGKPSACPRSSRGRTRRSRR